MFSDVEISLMALEDTIGARELQERQLDQRFQLAIYQERRKAEFNELASEFQFNVKVVCSPMELRPRVQFLVTYSILSALT